MKKALVLFLILPLFAAAQADRYSETDSTEYYRKLVGNTWRHALDSIRNSEAITKARQYYLRRVHATNNYSAFTLYTDIAHNDYSLFNNTLNQLGFSPLNETSTRFGLGISKKNAHTMFNLYFFTIGLNNTSSKPNSGYINTNFSNLLQFDWGYDILNAERISIYPYAGVSLRESTLVYGKNDDVNPNATDITNMRTDGNWNRLESLRLGYQYGMGFDYSFAYLPERIFKMIAFLKAGVNKPFKEDVYRHPGMQDYKAGIKQGEWVLTFGFKFATKR